MTFQCSIDPPSNRPSLEEFRRLCLSEFSFLTSDLSFSVEPLPTTTPQNPFQTRFVSPSARVIIQGRSFGSSICVVLERLSGGRAGLIDILALRSPESATRLLQFGDQPVLLRHAALALREHALDALCGEEEIFRAAEEQQLKMAESYERKDAV